MRIPTWPNTGGRNWSHWPGSKSASPGRAIPKTVSTVFALFPLARFEALAQVRGVHLMSLQVGPGTDQLATVPFRVTDLGSRLDPDSLGDLAAVMTNLDLVISVETAVAHLAGAWPRQSGPYCHWFPIGAGCWNAADSPWYPTMRLFRQSRLGDWDEVMERVQEALRLLVAGRVSREA